ncbi:hypothetical protein BFW86_22530 [Pseudomonas fluorescens]|nr:hypothetical protein BFW86_22530 [Pseudomonas fluorescens]
MNKAVNVAVVDGKTITQTVDLGAAKTGQPVRIKAVQGGKYILGEGEKGIAPENITIKRVGKNLHIALEGSDPDQPDLIIENFEGTGGQLVGIAEDGSYYPYISSDADQDRSAAFLYEGIESPQVLGAQSLAGFGNGLVAGSGIGWFWPALLGLGALGLLGGIYAATRDSDSKKDAGVINTDKGSIGSAHDNVGDKQGAIAPGESTDDRTPTFTGIGRPGTSVEIVDNGKTIGTAIVGEDGKWTFTPAEPGLSDGSHTIVIVPVDKDGNKGEPSPGHEIIVDTVAPGRPLLEGVFDDVAPNEGLIASGGHTNDTTPTLNGTAEAGSIVRIYDNGVEIGSVLAGTDGKWSFTPDPALTEGAHEFTLVAEDAAGNISVPSLPFPIVIDTTAPTKPGTGTGGIDDVLDNVGPIQGSIGSGDTTDDKTPTFTGGGATPGDTVVIIDNGVEIGTAIVGDDGKWTFTPEEPGLSEGSHEIVVVIRDPAGNESEPSDPHTVIIDTTAPAVPGIGAVFDDQGTVTGNLTSGDTTDDASPDLSGTAEPGTLVTIYDNGVPIGSVIATDGTWTFTPTPPLSNGAHTLTVTAKDASGNESAHTPGFDLVVMAGGIPAAPAIISVIDDQGSSTGQLAKDAATDDAQPTVNGTGTAGDTISVYSGMDLLGTTIVDANGQWSFTPDTPLADGQHNLTAQARDAAGNLSPITGSYPINVDTTAPAAPTGTTLTDDVGAITGTISDGTITDDANPTFGGVAEAGAVVIIYDQGIPIGSTTANANGVWSFTPATALDDGPHSLSARAVDSAGNAGPMGPATNFTVDTSNVVISITSVVDNEGTVTGNLSSGQTTDDTTPTLNGMATPGAIVTIYDNGVFLDTVTADATGRWTFTTPVLSEGSHPLTATSTTQAGGESAPTPVFETIIDTTAPGTPVIGDVSDDVGVIQGPVADGGSTDDVTPTLSGGGLQPGEIVLIRDGGNVIGSTTVGPNGSWSYTPTTPLNDGSHELTIVTVDPAGNPSAPSAPWTVIVDTAAPVAPTIDRLIDDAGNAIGGTTFDTTPTLEGTAEPFSIVSIYNGTTLLGTANAEADGSWKYTPDKLPPDGYNFTAVASDEAGNKSVPSSSIYLDILDVARGEEGFEGMPRGDLPQGTSIVLADGLSAQGTAEGLAITARNGGSGVGSNIMALVGGHIEFSPKVPTDYFELRVGGVNEVGSTTVSFFGVDGAVLNSVTVPVNGSSTTLINFTPPAGVLIGSVVVQSSSAGSESTGVSIDALKWGADIAPPPPLARDESEINADQIISIANVNEIEDGQVIEGGAGIDTFRITGADQVIDLTALADKVTSMEIIDITGTGNNTLNLSLGDVLAQGGGSLFTGDDVTQMMIKGNAGDVVNLDDLMPDGTDPGDWASMGTTTVAGVTYNVYQHSTLDAQLLVQDGVHTNLVV